MVSEFELKTRTGTGTDEDSVLFYALTDDAPIWLRDAVYEAHEGNPPDDWTYCICAYLWTDLEGSDPDSLEDFAYELADSLVDCYSYELYRWATPDRWGQIEDDLAGYPINTISNMLMVAQTLTIQRIASLLVEAYRTHCAEEADS